MGMEASRLQVVNDLPDAQRFWKPDRKMGDLLSRSSALHIIDVTIEPGQGNATLGLLVKNIRWSLAFDPVSD